MSANLFGKNLKRLRQATNLTLREFCLQNGFDPGNYSRLERGLFQPPKKSALLEKYAHALGLGRGSDEWIEFFDLAAASRGEIPEDLLSDEEVVSKLPVLFRTLRDEKLDSAALEQLVEKVRRT